MKKRKQYHLQIKVGVGNSILVNQETGAFRHVMDVVWFGLNCMKRDKRGKWVHRL